ncbi:hypothetical protein [Oscillatoria salina]|uniref:hypothetical protein n=1 Tax=Oscillatoria salina TaxID=331517 RepID=UPI001CCC68F6|nr:hypothetical protein [Oscillatoria salina]
MLLINAFIISFLFLGSTEVLLYNSKFSSVSFVNSSKAILPLEFPSQLFEPTFYEPSCQELPLGFGIPGFPPGVEKSQVEQMFGVPAKVLSGYWPNTIAVIYYLVPDRVSLGFLFDKDTQVLRQTEASFATSVQLKTVLKTLDNMLGCNLNKEIEAGLQQVWLRQENSYSFTLNKLEGTIERDDSDRIYIGIWQEDLH